MPLKLQIDVEAITSQFKDFALSIKEDMQNAINDLAALTRTRVIEEVDRDLHTSLAIYKKALSEPQQVSEGVWVISLDEKAFFIEEGIEAGKDMKPDLLKGKKSVVIPFRYDKTPTQNTPFTQGLISQIRQVLRKEKLSIKKIEYDAHGSPRTGKLHEYNLGGPRPGKGNTPALTRLSIYQTPIYSDIKTKKMTVRRDVLTFRTVSSGPASAGKWIHPGLTAKKYMDKAMDMAIQEWEEKILPEILEKYK